MTVRPLKIQKAMFRDESRELTQDEYKRLVHAAESVGNRRLSLVIQTICATGIRVSELKFITVDAVRIGHTEISNKGKRRTIFLPDRLRRILRKYLKETHKTEGAVFTTRNGKPLDRSNIWRDMKALCESAGVEPDKVFPHNLRHLFARTYYGIEKDLSRLADILGHSSVNTTRISLNDSFDNDKLHGDTGGVNTAFKYLTAEFYSRDLSMKQKSARLVKFRRGEYQSKICPYGYQKGPDGRMKPDEKTAPVVRLIFELAQNGKKIREIIEELFSRKIPTPGEYKAANGQAYHDISRCRGIWERSTLLRILNDERYTGTYIMGKREIKEVGSNRKRLKDESEWIKIPDHHPAIVSQEEYETAQIHLRKRQCSKKTIVAYTLRGKVYCGCCGHAMVRMPAKHPAFRCQYTSIIQFK